MFNKFQIQKDAQIIQTAVRVSKRQSVKMSSMEYLLDPKTNEVPAKQITHNATDAVAIGGLSRHASMSTI